MSFNYFEKQWSITFNRRWVIAIINDCKFCIIWADISKNNVTVIWKRVENIYLVSYQCLFPSGKKKTLKISDRYFWHEPKTKNCSKKREKLLTKVVKKFNLVVLFQRPKSLRDTSN